MDTFIKDEILRRVTLPCDLRIFGTVGSTNDYAKACPPDSLPLCVVADEQTAGRGRLGRSFYSPKGSGLYLTAAAKKTFDPSAVPFYTMGAAVAAARAVEEVSDASPSIKWVNDLYLNGLKISGILTEAVTDGAAGDGSALIVIGCGINCFSSPMPGELAGIAGAISDEYGSFSRNALAGALLDGLLRLLEDPDPSAFLDEYRRRCITVGRELSLRSFDGSSPVRVRALGVADDGALIVRYLEGPLSGTVGHVTSGEVTAGSVTASAPSCTR